MIILGKNKDDTGGQLERLTKRLLESRRYTNVTIDNIGEGGNEVDVQAEFPSPVPTSQHSRRLIAECKAWATPIALPDWLKFLGKIFTEESKIGNEVDGLFVALSGVNGAVRGNYDSLRQRKKNVTLLDGDSLVAELSTLYAIPKPAVIIEKLKHFTPKQYSVMELAYYGEQFYWTFKFPGGDIAVLTANGDPADSALLAQMGPMLEDRLQGQRMLDLMAEKKAKERSILSRQYLLTTLFNKNGTLPAIFLNSEQEGYSPSELQAAAKEIQSSGWVTASPAGDLQISFTPTTNLEKFVQVLQFVFQHGILKADLHRLFSSQLFHEFFNDHFLANVSATQGSLPLDQEIRSKLLDLCRCSPSALIQAITPHPMIVTHRTGQASSQQNLDAEDLRFFMRSLLRAFRKDFRNGLLAEHMYHHCGLREIEVSERYQIKDKAKVLIEHEVSERVLIGEAHESLGGGLIYVEALSGAPQPWDLAKATPESETNNPTQ